MHLLYMSIGGNRRRAVIEELSDITVGQDTGVVLAEGTKIWSKIHVPQGFTKVELGELERRHPLYRLEHLLLYQGPRFLLLRVFAHGKLRPLMRKVAGAYQRRIADKLHKSCFQPLFRRLRPHWRERLVERHVPHDPAFDVIVVTDATSLPYLAKILDGYAARGEPAPKVAFSMDHIWLETAASAGAE